MTTRVHCPPPFHSSRSWRHYHMVVLQYQWEWRCCVASHGLSLSYSSFVVAPLLLPQPVHSGCLSWVHAPLSPLPPSPPPPGVLMCAGLGSGWDHWAPGVIRNPAPTGGWGTFSHHERRRSYQIRYSTSIIYVFCTYSTHMREMAVFCKIPQNCTRIHENTSIRKSESTNILGKGQNTTEYLQNTVFSKNSQRIGRPSEYHSRIPRRNHAEYAKEYRILHRIQNTAKKTGILHAEYHRISRSVLGGLGMRFRFFPVSSSFAHWVRPIQHWW